MSPCHLVIPRWETLWLNLHQTPPETLTRFASAVGWALRALQAESEPLAEMERVLTEALAGLEGLTAEEAGQWERVAWFLVLLVTYRREEPQLAERLVEQARGSKFGLAKEVTRMGRTIAEQIEARGRAEGEASGVRRALVTVPERRFGPLPGEIAAAVEQADVPTLVEWLGKAATASSLEEVGLLPT